jgi:hypothetical protein
VPISLAINTPKPFKNHLKTIETAATTKNKPE